MKGLRRDFKYIEKRLDEINARSKIVIEKIKPTLRKPIEDK